MPKWSELANFTDREKEALEALKNHRFLLYGGTRGCGKSHFLRWVLLQILLECHKSGIQRPRVMLACESYPTLTDRQISKIVTEFPAWLGGVKRTQEDGLVFQLHESFGGGVMALRNLDNPEKHVGSENCAIGVDQIEKIDKDTFDILRGSLRFPGMPRPRFIATSNPGGIGHVWVKQYWIDRDFPDEMKALANEFVFIRGYPTDNPYLDQSYWDDLNSLPENLRRAWVDGDYEVFSGLAFPEFSDRHIVDKPFSIPDDWIKIRGVDSGYTRPFACVWVARDPDTGRYYVYREISKAGLTDRQQARFIKEMSGNDDAYVTYADPAMFRIHNSKDIVVTTSADEFMAEGVYLTKGDNDRINGKRKIDRLLRDLSDGKPGLMFFPNCKGIIRQMKTLILDEKKVEDVDTRMEDDLYDALRYALTSVRPKTEVLRIKSKNPWLELTRI